LSRAYQLAAGPPWKTSRSRAASKSVGTSRPAPNTHSAFDAARARISSAGRPMPAATSASATP